jgi:hypothetical protein
MSQFNEASFGNPPPKKKTPVLMIVIILLVVLVVLPAICCGVFGYLGFNTIMTAGAREIIRPIEHTPVMQEHIGEISSAQMNIMETAKRAEKTGEEGILIIDVEGTKGKGKLLLKGGGGQNEIEQATLELPDGRTFPIHLTGDDHGGEHDHDHDHGQEEAMPAEEQ